MARSFYLQTAFGSPVTYSGNGATQLEIKGDLQINTGVTLTTGMSADFIVNGNFSQSAASTFNLQNSTQNNTVILNGDVSSQEQ